MAQQCFLDVLSCEHCGSGFDLEWRAPLAGPEIETGVLRCLCYRYPIVLGIPVLRQLSPPHNNIDPVVARLEGRDVDGAVRLLCTMDAGERASTAPSPTLLDRLFGRQPPSNVPAEVDGVRPGESLREALGRLRAPSYADYLYFRHGNPSLLAALPVLAALVSAVGEAPDAERKWVLDLGCGSGHTAFTQCTWASPGTEVVAADVDFVNLMLAKRFFAPQAHFVCFDAERGLPFRDGIFHAAFSLDCVHYIRAKYRLGLELRRVSRSDAVFAISHLHNAGASNPNPGIPLHADGYAKVFEPLGGRVHAEAVLLDGFVRTGSLNLRGSVDDEDLRKAAAFIYLSLGRLGTEGAIGGLDELMLRRSDALTLNPLYQASAAAPASSLSMRWPSESLREECYAEFQPLKEEVSVTAEVLEALRTRNFSGLPRETLAELVRTFVLVPLPNV